MNLDHPNKNEQQMKETLQEHEFPFDPMAWQDMKAKLSGSSTVSTSEGQRRSDRDQPPGTSFNLKFLMIMALISFLSIALWFGLSQPIDHTNNTPVTENDVPTSVEKQDEAGAGNTPKEELAEVGNTTATFTRNKRKNTPSESENRTTGTGIPTKTFPAQETGKPSDNAFYMPVTTTLADVQPDANQSFANRTLTASANSLFAKNGQGNTPFPTNEMADEAPATNARQTIDPPGRLKLLEMSMLVNMDSTEDDNIVLPFTDTVRNGWSNMDVKFMTGRATMGTNDNILLSFGSEFTIKFHRLLSTSVSMAYGYQTGGLSENVSMFHTDLNVLYSPFGNNRKGNFKIGTGGSVLFVNDTYYKGNRIEGGVIIDEYGFEKRRSLGFNIILEYELSIGERMLLGVESKVHQYFSGDVNTNLGIKLGVRL